MNRLFLADFGDRKREVRRYLGALAAVEREFLRRDATRRQAVEERLKILRGGFLLILYNTVEASVRSAVEAVYDELEQNRTSFTALHETFRKRILREFKVNVNADEHHAMRDLAIEIVKASFVSSKLVSGNVDAKKVWEIAKDIGFSIVTNPRRTNNGADLVIVKRLRNDLAHGLKRFSEVGRDHTIKDLEDLASTTLGYLEEILTNVQTFLDRRDYLEPTPDAPDSAP